MEMKLFETLDNENVINKTINLIYVLNIKMKNDVDLVQPTIILNDKNEMNFQLCNYCYLEDFNRYYFIRSIENINSNIWRLSLECDVLESFKDDILISDVEINRRMKQGEYYVQNSKVETVKTIDVYKSDVKLRNTKNIILSTIGG